MIIWIDGVNGVGKSHIASELEKKLPFKNVEHVDSDIYWIEYLKKNRLQAIQTGFNSYNNKSYLCELRTMLENMCEEEKIPIVSMSLVTDECGKELLKYFCLKNILEIHIILKAETDEILSRIESDTIRNKSDRLEQRNNIGWQKNYLESRYSDAIRISTNQKSQQRVVDEIVSFFTGEKFEKYYKISVAMQIRKTEEILEKRNHTREIL